MLSLGPASYAMLMLAIALLVPEFLQLPKNLEFEGHILKVVGLLKGLLDQRPKLLGL